MKNILITGGMGYIGGRVATHLLEEKQDLRIFLTTRGSGNRNPSWVKPFSMVSMDLLDESSITGCLKGQDIDTIIHLAAMNEIESMADPERALEVNTRGTYKLLYQARLNHVERFVYFSTIHVYGVLEAAEITEASPTRAHHPYAITHRAAEDFVNYFNRYHGMKTLIFRLSNGYGYPADRGVDRWTLVFNDLCRQAVQDGKIVLNSSGRQSRDFISLYDVARAVDHFLFRITEGWGDGLYNLGGGCRMTIREVAEAVAKVYWRRYGREISGITVSPGPNEPREYPSFSYRIDKLRGTNFSLKGQMELEIEKTLEICEGFLS